MPALRLRLAHHGWKKVQILEALRWRSVSWQRLRFYRAASTEL